MTTNFVPEAGRVFEFADRAFRNREYKVVLKAMSVLDVSGDAARFRNYLEVRALTALGRSKDAAHLAEVIWTKAPDAHNTGAFAQALIDCRRFKAARTFLDGKPELLVKTPFLLEIRGMLELHVGDPFAGAAWLEAGLGEGMEVKPHVAARMLDFYRLTGNFERAEAWLASVDPSTRSAWRLKVDYSKSIWADRAKYVPGSYEPETLVQQARDAIKTEDLVTCAYLVQRVFASRPTADALWIAVSRLAHQLTEFGNFDCASLIGQSLGAGISSNPRPGAELALRHAERLIPMYAFADAAEIFAGLSCESLDNDLLLSLIRMSLLCGAAGEMKRCEVGRIVEASAARLPEDVLAPFLRYAGGAFEEAGGSQRSLDAVRRSRPRVLSPRLAVAVCVFGQLRGFEQAAALSAKALSAFDTTAFVATWYRVGGGLGSENRLDRGLPPALIARLPIHLNSQDFLRRELPAVAAKLSSDRVVTRAELAGHYNSEHVSLLDEAAFDTRCAVEFPAVEAKFRNQLKMFHAMSASLSLCKEYEQQSGRVFDAVIRIRADRGIIHVGEDDLCRAAEKDIFLTDHFYSWAVGDQASISSSYVGSLLAELWPAIERLRSFRVVPGGTGRAAEWLMGEYLVAHGIEVGQVAGTTFSGLCTRRLEIAGLADTLAGEPESMHLTDDVRQFVGCVVDQLTEEGDHARAAQLRSTLLATTKSSVGSVRLSAGVLRIE